MGSNMYTSIDQDTSTDMTMIINMDIMFDQRTTIDDAVIANNCCCINDHTMAHSGSRTELGVPADNGMG